LFTRLSWDIDPGVNIESELRQKRPVDHRKNFPTGTPVEQLKALNEMTKKLDGKAPGMGGAEPFEYEKPENNL